MIENNQKVKLCDTWKLYEIQISALINKVWNTAMLIHLYNIYVYFF